MKQLAVFFNDTMAGMLTEQNPGVGYVFKYDEGYLRSDLPPISLTLPKREAAYYSESLFPFFTNMLPEGGNRRVICRSCRIDESDLFSLLYYMSDKDIIGAVNLRKTTI
jgi:serine/threonine-protein kinase HipA